MLDNDIQKITAQLKTIPTYCNLDPRKQIALADMAFNLGFHGILRFQHMWAALEAGDCVEAAKEMLNSTWAAKAPNRARELASLVK